MLRASHPHDNVFIACDPTTVAHVMCFIRCFGQEERERQAELPKGVHRRGQRFTIRYKKHDGALGYKVVDTLDDANVFMTSPPEDEDGKEAEMDAADEEIMVGEASADAEAEDPSAGVGEASADAEAEDHSADEAIVADASDVLRL